MKQQQSVIKTVDDADIFLFSFFSNLIELHNRCSLLQGEFQKKFKR